MRIKKVSINNYRSIESVTVSFENNPRILIGINETGKTNILKAFSSIDKNFDFNFERDTRMPSDIKYERKPPYFDYYFQLNDTEIENVIKEAFGEDENLFPCKIRKNAKVLNYLRYRISYDKTNQRKSTWYYGGLVESAIEVKKGYFEPIEASADVIQYADNSTAKKISEVRYISSKDVSNWDLLKDKFKELTKDTIEKILVDSATELYEDDIPKVYFWQYNPKILLDEPVAIDTFLTNPDSVPILKNMFILYGIEKSNIKTEVDRIKTIPAHFQNLLKRISETITNHLKSVWPEVGDVEVSIIQTGNNFVLGVQDKVNLFTFGNRSDGFKRFICFLLDMSTRYTNKEIKNALILLDEPEIGLHPSGVRYLRDELIKISKENDCIIATHSIFMIDTNKLERHLIIEKNVEATTIQEADDKNFVKEELLFEALGISQFQLLKNKNIVLEGWTDYENFCIMHEHLKKNIKKFNRDSVGICWLDGVNENKVFPKVGHFLSAKSNFLIISDEDEVALRTKQKFDTTYPKHKQNWITYKDVISKKSQKQKTVTLEDLLPKKWIVEHINNFLLQTHPEAQIKMEEKNIDVNAGFVISWKQFLDENYSTIDKEKIRLLKDTYKEHLVELFRNEFKKPTVSDDFEDVMKTYLNLFEKIENHFES